MLKKATKKELRTFETIIYIIINTLNGKQYVGKALGTFNERYSGGRWWDYPSNRYFENAINKYGRKNFYVSILEYNVTTGEELGLLEQYYIKKHNTLFPNGYNFYEGGENHHRVYDKQYIVYNHKIESTQSFSNISQFSRENNADKGSLQAVLRKERKQHKHWTLPDVEIKKWEVVSPYGEEFKLLDGEIHSFCKTHNLTDTNFSKMLNRIKFRHHKGWRLKNRPAEIKEIKCPNGEIVIVNYRELTKFCKENDLCPSTMTDVCNDKRLHCREFRLLKNEERYFEQFIPLKYYFISDINGVVHTFTDFHEFSIKHNISVAKLFMLFRKEIKYTDGWFFPETKIKIHWLKDPNGKTFRVMEGKPFGKFCKENKIKRNCISHVINGGTKSYDGWTKGETAIDYQI